MIRMILGAALLAAAAGSAEAQGFSGSGVAGVAQAQGVTASPGPQAAGGPGDARAFAPDPEALRLRQPRPIEAVYGPWPGRRGFLSAAPQPR